MVQPGLVGYLEDTYTNTSSILDLNGLTSITFTVDNVIGSNAADRFKIVFKPATVLPLSFTSITAVKQNRQIVVNWKTTNEVNVQFYEVERSTDAVAFKKMHTTVANNLAVNSYNWIDENPADNYNYYRIKSIDANGNIAYSKVVKVFIGEKAEMTVYPNPVTNNIINFHWGGAVAGIFHFRLLNLNGLLILKKQIKHAANTATEHIALSKNIAEGMYRLEIIAADNIKTTISVAVLK